VTVPQHASHDEDASIGELVKEVSTQFSTLLRGEIALAKLELTQTFKFGGLGLALVVAAVVIVPFSLTFGLIALAEGLVSAGLWRWVAYLIVFAFLMFSASLLAFVGVRKFKKVRAPRRTIATTRDTVTALRGAGHRD
jgi:uncharacterized membrane protein YqjE